MSLKRRVLLSVSALAVLPGFALLGISAFLTGAGGEAWGIVYGIFGALSLVAAAITLPSAWGLNSIACRFPGEDMSVEVKHGKSMMVTVFIASSLFGIILGALSLHGNDVTKSIMMVTIATVTVCNCAIRLKNHWLALLDEQNFTATK